MEGYCPQCKHPKIVPLGPNGLCIGYHEKKVKKAAQSLEPVNPKSEKQAARDKVYVVLAAAHKAAHPFCEAKLAGCSHITMHTHHKKGRIGKDYLDTRFFLAACDKCHRKIEDFPAFAKALGLSVSRLSKETTDSKNETQCG